MIGGNLKIRRFEKVVAEHGCVIPYVHGGGRIGVIVDADTDVVNDTVKEAMHNIAMQIAALNPKYVSRDEVSADYIAHEKILLAQIMNDPKESEAGEGNQRNDRRTYQQRTQGSMPVDQVYVKAEDGKQTVAKYLEEVSKAVDGTVKVKEICSF